MTGRDSRMALLGLAEVVRLVPFPRKQSGCCQDAANADVVAIGQMHLNAKPHRQRQEVDRQSIVLL